MATEIIAGKTFVEESYPISDIGGGVISKGQAVRHFEKKHPEYRVIAISSFKIDHQDETINVRVQVQKNKVLPVGGNVLVIEENCPRLENIPPIAEQQKLLNPGYDELTDKLKAAEIQVEEFKKGAEGRPCLCGKCADNLQPGYDELVAKHAKSVTRCNQLVDETAESEKQLLALQAKLITADETYEGLRVAHVKLLKEYENENDGAKAVQDILAHAVGADDDGPDDGPEGEPELVDGPPDCNPDNCENCESHACKVEGEDEQGDSDGE